MDSRKDAALIANNSQFYFLAPLQLLEAYRLESAKRSISTAALMREALWYYLSHKGLNDSSSANPTDLLHTDKQK